jgi:hypothetical protein
VEGSNGAGRPLAQQLLEGGEHVVDVPAKLAARVRLFDTGHNRKTDARDAHSIAIVAARTTTLRVLQLDGELEALRMLTDRRGIYYRRKRAEGKKSPDPHTKRYNRRRRLGRPSMTTPSEQPVDNRREPERGRVRLPRPARWWVNTSRLGHRVGVLIVHAGRMEAIARRPGTGDTTGTPRRPSTWRRR